MLGTFAELVETRQIVFCSDSYFAADGLMRLHLNDARSTYDSSVTPKDTVCNDNGILFAAYFYFLTHIKLHELSYPAGFHERFVKAAILTRSSVTRGIFYRNPGRSDSLNSLDNYVGLVAGAVLFEFQDPIKDVCDFGAFTGFRFDNRNPDDPGIRSWRQGADIAFYQLCDKRLPTWSDFIWLIAGIVQNTFQDDDKRTSEFLLTWLRLRALDVVMQRNEKPSSTRALMFMLITLARKFWVARLVKNTPLGVGIEHVFNVYFKDYPDHPVRKLARNVIY